MVSRRDFLKLSGLFSLSLGLVACGTPSSKNLPFLYRSIDGSIDSWNDLQMNTAHGVYLEKIAPGLPNIATRIHKDQQRAFSADESESAEAFVLSVIEEEPNITNAKMINPRADVWVVPEQNSNYLNSYADHVNAMQNLLESKLGVLNQPIQIITDPTNYDKDFQGSNVFIGYGYETVLRFDIQWLNGMSIVGNETREQPIKITGGAITNLYGLETIEDEVIVEFSDTNNVILCLGSNNQPDVPLKAPLSELSALYFTDSIQTYVKQLNDFAIENDLTPDQGLIGFNVALYLETVTEGISHLLIEEYISTLEDTPSDLSHVNIPQILDSLAQTKPKYLYARAAYELFKQDFDGTLSRAMENPAQFMRDLGHNPYAISIELPSQSRVQLETQDVPYVSF